MITALFLNKLSRHGITHKPLYAVSFMIMFWAIFDSSFSFMVPQVITEAGLSKTFMGVILASSSMSGAVFDFVLSKYLVNTHYRRVYLMMFALCAFCPLLLWQGKTIWFYFAAMALWGFYYDLSNFGNLDFISRKSLVHEHSSSFGILWAFRSLGYTLGPIIIGLLAAEVLSYKPFLSMWIALGISAIFFGILLYLTANKDVEYLKKSPPHKVLHLSEFTIMVKIGKQIFPVLILTTFLWVIDAFFWTIGPLMLHSVHETSFLSGIFVTMYTLPATIFGWLVGKSSKKLGKKKTALIACCSASFIFTGFVFATSAVALMATAFLASCCLSICLPLINGVFSDFIARDSEHEKEIEALQDLFTNLGYIIGPILAGFLADQIGSRFSFAALGLLGLIITGILLFTTPRKIHISLS